MTYDADPDTRAQQSRQRAEQPPRAVPERGTPRPAGPGPAPTPESTSVGIPADTSATTSAGTPAGTSATTSTQAQLIPRGERDKLALRLQQAVNTFVDGPRRAVEEADSVFEEVTRCLTDAVTERRGSLRSGWAAEDHEAETEELRVALRTYREATERLLRM
ncbi:hypothetical protein [Streptomyces sp. NPDC055287]